MLTKQKSYMAASEADTFDLVQDLVRKVTFIKSIPDEVQAMIVHHYATALAYITTHGSEHKITLDHLRLLSEELISIRHFASAAVILDRACLGCKRCYGQKHVNVALVLSRQAYAFSADRKFEQSVTCYMKSQHLLEDLYEFQLMYNEFQTSARSGNVGEIVLIPSIAVPIVDGLGYALGALQRHHESEFYFRTLLNYYIDESETEGRSTFKIDHENKERHFSELGKQHPEALKAINKLAKALQAQGKYSEADRLCGDSLDDSIVTLGPNHPTTQTSVVTVAQLKHAQGDIADAEEMYRRSLACNEEVLGSSHAETLSNVVLIAGLRAEQKDYRGAEVLYSRALAGYEATLGRHHSSTVDAVHYIGDMLLRQSKPTAALVMLQRAYDERVGYYGPQHPNTLTTLFCLGKGHHLESLWKHRPNSGELVKSSLEVLRAALEGFDNTLGPDSNQSIECCDFLSDLLLQSYEFATALPYSRRVYVYLHNSGVSTSTTGKSAKNKAPATVTAPGKVYGPLHRRTAEAAYRLATLLENCIHGSGGSADAARHSEAAGLFMQTHEVYRNLLERLERNEKTSNSRSSEASKNAGTFVQPSKDSLGEEELTIEETKELLKDAMEQYQHATRRSMY